MKFLNFMTVRIFLLTSGVCLLAVTTISWQGYKFFYESQFESKQAQQKTEVTNIAVPVDQLLLNYRHEIREVTEKPESIKGFVDKWAIEHPTLVYGHFIIDRKSGKILESSWTPPGDPKLLLGKTLEIAKLESESRAKSLMNSRVKPNMFAFEDLQEDFTLPILAVVHATTTKSGANLLALLFLWKGPLFGNLTGSENKQYMLVGSNDSLVGLTGKPPINKNALKKTFFKKIFIQKKPWLFFEKLEEGSQFSLKFWTTSYRKLAIQDNIFIVLRESYGSAFLNIKKVVGTTLLWACVFILLLFAGCYFTIFNFSLALNKSVKAVQRMAKGDLSPMQFENYGFEINGLNYAINRLSENFARALRQQKRQVQKTKTIEMSDAIKQGVMPLHKPNHKYLGVTAFSRQTPDFNGNWFGVTNMAPGINCVFMGESSGSGPSTAVMAASMCAACESLLKASAHMNDGIPNIERVINDLNSYLYEASGGANVARLFLALTNFKKGTVEYVNAGLQKPFIIQRFSSKDGARQQPEIQSLDLVHDVFPIVLKESMLPMGVKKDVRYESTSVAMKAGDKLFIFSSGLVKCRSILGRPWGRKSLIENALTLAKSTADAAKDELIERVAYHSRGAEISNDIGLLILEVSKEWKVGVKIEEEVAAS